MSVIVGTVDGDGVPAPCRGVGLVSRDDFATLTVYVPVATSQETLANVATTRRIAVAASHPITHTTYQFKGVTRAVRLAKEEEAAVIRRYLDAWANVLDQVGMPEHLAQAVNHWPAFAIEAVVEEIFDQTPGPSAGRRIA